MHHINGSLIMKMKEQSDCYVLSHSIEHGHLDIRTMFHAVSVSPQEEHEVLKSFYYGWCLMNDCVYIYLTKEGPMTSLII